MLDVVQTIAKTISSSSIGSLATFERYVDGLSSIISSRCSNTNSTSNRHFRTFESKVLKTLFMVKYVKEFTPNLDNITTLLVDQISGSDIGELKRVHGALNYLCNQTTFKKVVSLYRLLTDVEKDIEKIKSNQGNPSKLLTS